MISASFLSIKENVKDNIEKLDSTSIDMLHVDIMDGIFVANRTWSFDEIDNLLKSTIKPKDVHLMVKDIKKYIDEYQMLNPEYITFHYEATNNVLEIIKYIKSLGIKVGLSIKPNTSVDCINEYLEDIDLILVMSVEPGKGGQKFIENSVSKINQLYNLRQDNQFHYVIEVDGGINDLTSKKCSKADILVIGSFITSGNYQEQIDKISS